MLQVPNRGLHQKFNPIVGQAQIDDLEIENEKNNRVSEVIKIPPSSMDLYMFYTKQGRQDHRSSAFTLL